MRKTLLSVLAIMVLCFNAQAAPVSHSTTAAVATNFWNTYRTPGTPAVKNGELVLAPQAELPFCDIYRTHGDGFVIVANDDRVQPVLAYSFDSPFPDELHPSLRYWLGGYNAQIAEAVDYNIEPTADVTAAWQGLIGATVPDEPLTLISVPAMLNTRWNQSEPYNNHCPYDTVEHARSVVGCVATAMAQLMKYWNHPSCGTGSHSYDPGTGYASYSYGILSADFANTTYIWEYMPSVLYHGSRSYNIDAVATLSYHCGVAVEMMYSPEASGAYTISYGNPEMACSERALKEYFRYDRSLHGEQRYYYSESNWCAMIDTDIVAGRPILYTGHDNTGGHAFVLDGADTNGRYHFNWGWGGYGDGFYTINNLAPGPNGGAGGNSTYTFNQGQTAVFGVKPIPQQFDTIDIIDTICSTDATYDIYEYSIFAVPGDYTIVHLDTVINLHLVTGPVRYIHLDANGGEGNTRTLTYCPRSGVTMPENTFTREGYEFAGWCRNPEGLDSIYFPGQTAFIHNTCFFYAIWRHGTADIDSPHAADVAVWPNVTADHVNLSVDNSSEATITIIDAHGRVVLQRTTLGGKAKISLERLPAGIYTVMVLTSDQKYNSRIIKL